MLIVPFFAFMSLGLSPVCFVFHLCLVVSPVRLTCVFCVVAPLRLATCVLYSLVFSSSSSLCSTLWVAVDIALLTRVPTITKRIEKQMRIENKIRGFENK